MDNEARCWINGRATAASEACVSVFDHGLLYGDGVFEGIRFYNGCAFRLQAHLHRLQESASAIGLTIPYSAAQLAHAVDEIVGDFHQPDGYLRLIVTRGCGLLGLDPAVCTQPNVILIADRLNIVPAEKRADGIRVIISSTRRPPADVLDPRIKSLNYLNNILARIEANRAGVDEAIMLNTHGNVAEGSAENVFVVREQTLLTPRTTDGALRGITRETVLELAAAAGIAAERTMLTCYDLYNSDECFLTGTGAELIPVREINGRRLPASPGPIFATLMDAFEQLVRRETMRP
jgi:branched-chain amino acid aminotransferase